MFKLQQSVFFNNELSKFYFFHFKEINTFIQQECVTLIKSDSKDLYRWKRFLFCKNTVHLSFLFICEFQKNIKQQNCFQQ